MYSIKLIHIPYSMNQNRSIPSGQLSKQLIQDLDCSIAQNKGFVLALRGTRLLKLNSSKHIKMYTFLFKINYMLHQFTSMEFTEVINNGDSLTCTAFTPKVKLS